MFSLALRKIFLYGLLPTLTLLLLLIVFTPSSVYASSTATLSGSVANLNWTGNNPEYPVFWSSNNNQTISYWSNSVSSPQTWVNVNNVQKSSAYQSFWDWDQSHDMISTYSGAEGAATATGHTDAVKLSFTSTTTSYLGSLDTYAQGARVSQGFRVSGDGTLTFTFPYTANVELARNAQSENAWGSIAPRAQVESYGQVLYGTIVGGNYTSGDLYKSWAISGTGPLNATYDTEGTMIVSLFFNNNDYGYFSVSINGESGSYSMAGSQVPLPPSLVLLAPGLAALIGLRRKYFA